MSLFIASISRLAWRPPGFASAWRGTCADFVTAIRNEQLNGNLWITRLYCVRSILAFGRRCSLCRRWYRSDDVWKSETAIRPHNVFITSFRCRAAEHGAVMRVESVQHFPVHTLGLPSTYHENSLAADVFLLSSASLHTSSFRRAVCAVDIDDRSAPSTRKVTNFN